MQITVPKKQASGHGMPFQDGIGNHGAAQRSVRAHDRRILTYAMPVVVLNSSRFCSGFITNFSTKGLGMHLIGNVETNQAIRIEFLYRHLPVLCGWVKWNVANRVGIQLDGELPKDVARILRLRSQA